MTKSVSDKCSYLSLSTGGSEELRFEGVKLNCLNGSGMFGSSGDQRITKHISDDSLTEYQLSYELLLIKASALHKSNDPFSRAPAMIPLGLSADTLPQAMS